MAALSADLAMWMLSAATGALGIFVLFALGTPGIVLLFAPLLILWIRSGTRGLLKAGDVFAGSSLPIRAKRAPHRM